MWLLWPEAAERDTALEVPLDTYAQLVSQAYGATIRRDDAATLSWRSHEKGLVEVLFTPENQRHAIEADSAAAVANFVAWWRSDLGPSTVLTLADSGHQRSLRITSHLSRDAITAFVTGHQ